MQEANLEASPQEEVSFFTGVDSGDIWEAPNNQSEIPVLEAPEGQPRPGQVKQPVEGSPQGQPEAEAETDPQYPTEGIPEHMKPEDVYTMARYFQSQKSKAEQQAQQLQRELEAMAAANPISQYAAKDPAFMAHVAQYLSGSSSGNQPSGAASVGGAVAAELPKKPERPKRPANLDPYSDEATEYQQKLDAYYDERDAYYELIQETALQQQQRIQQEKLQAEQQRAVQTQIYNQAKFEYGLNDAQAAEFIQWAQDPNQVNRLDLWVNAFKLDKKLAPAAAVPSTPQPQQGQVGPMGRRVQQVQTAASVPAGAAPVQQESFFVKPGDVRSIW